VYLSSKKSVGRTEPKKWVALTHLYSVYATYTACYLGVAYVHDIFLLWDVYLPRGGCGSRKICCYVHTTLRELRVPNRCSFYTKLL
jgi:hypothetical protein